MLSSFLRNQFHSYMKDHPDDIKQCLDITSMWKKPSYYHFTAYYYAKTNQLIWEGFVVPRDNDDDTYSVFTILDGANTLTVGDFLMNTVCILDDYTDLAADNQAELIEKLVIDIDESIVINN